MDVETETAMIAMLSASFSLVKPAGVTVKETRDWLQVALDTLAHIPFHIFETGCRSARLTCTHHSQIVPAIVTATRQALEWHNRPRIVPLTRLPDPTPAATDDPLPDPETLQPSLKRIGLQKGWIVDRDGRLEWAA